MDAPQGRFALHAGLAAPGAMPPAEALTLVEADWQRQVVAGTVNDEVFCCYVCDARSMVKYLPKRCGTGQVRKATPIHLFEWVRAPRLDGTPAKTNTRYGRRSAARPFFLAYTCLGIFDVNPAESALEVVRRKEHEPWVRCLRLLAQTCAQLRASPPPM